jgi:hypothetical protein
MLIQSNILKVILGENIPFVYPNLKWTHLIEINIRDA